MAKRAAFLFSFRSGIQSNVIGKKTRKRFVYWDKMAPQDAMFVWPIITYSVIDTPLLSFFCICRFSKKKKKKKIHEESERNNRILGFTFWIIFFEGKGRKGNCFSCKTFLSKLFCKSKQVLIKLIQKFSKRKKNSLLGVNQ